MTRAGLADFVDQPARLGGAVDDVGEFRLDAEPEVEALGDRHGLFHLGAHVAPGLGGGIVRVVAPLVVRIARAGAQRDQARAHRRRRQPRCTSSRRRPSARTAGSGCAML